MFWRVMTDDVSQQRLCFLGAKNFLEALAMVGIEIVHHQMDALRRGINLLEQVLYESHEVSLGAMIGDHDRPPPSLGFNCHEQIASPRALILVILLCGRTGLGWQRRPQILEPLFALLVQANDWLFWMERTCIKVE